MNGMNGTHGNGKDSFLYPLRCTITGVPLGHLNLIISAGHMPYLSHWDKQICYHPYFSLEQSKLITFVRDEWNRLSREIINESITDQESTNIRVGFVAILYSLGSIKQDSGITILPEIGIVQSNLESLISLAYWQNYLDSKRFNFPFLHISKLNDNCSLIDVGDYLGACWKKKDEYESGMSEIVEKEKARIAEKAIIAIRNTFLKPPSKKLLWQWIKGNLPPKWAPDAEGWLATIFLGSVATSLEFEIEDIELMEEIIQSSCPIGNSVMFAVKERINEIKKNFREHYDTFTIEEDGLAFIREIQEEQERDETPEPKQEDFGKNKAAFYVARAKWQLAHPVNLAPKILVAIESARAKLPYKAEDL